MEIKNIKISTYSTTDTRISNRPSEKKNRKDFIRTIS